MSFILLIPSSSSLSSSSYNELTSTSFSRFGANIFLEILSLGLDSRSNIMARSGLSSEPIIGSGIVATSVMSI